MSNLEEYKLGTNINLQDTDGDGMSDKEDVDQGSSPLVNDLFLDDDMDGQSNAYEYTHGSDPNNPDTDGDGIIDGLDSNPLFNPVWMVPVYHLLLN